MGTDEAQGERRSDVKTRTSRPALACSHDNFVRDKITREELKNENEEAETEGGIWGGGLEKIRVITG